MLPKWLWRLLAALTVALLGLLVVNGPASAFQSHHEATFMAYVYDHPDGSDILAGATTERGPPTTYDRDTTHLTDDQWSSGASAHSDGLVPPVAIDYDHPDALVQLARPTATTDSSSFAFHCSRVAANAGDDVVRALSATERRTLDDALRPDKLDHIFDPKHNFQPLVQQFGSREAAMEQIIRSIGGPLPPAGRFEIAQSVGGQTVVIRGAVVDGIPRIGTAFTP